MPTLRQLRLDLGWPATKLAREAGVTRQAVAGAERGFTVRADVAKAIAEALSKAYGREIKPWEIEELSIS